MFKEFEINGVTYKLRLDTKNCIALEEKLGHSPLDEIVAVEDGKIPTFSFIITVLYYAMLKYHPGTKLEEVYSIFDTYIENGGSIMDLLPIVLDVFKQSGFFNNPQNKTVEKKIVKKA